MVTCDPIRYSTERRYRETAVAPSTAFEKPLPSRNSPISDGGVVNKGGGVWKIAPMAGDSGLPRILPPTSSKLD